MNFATILLVSVKENKAFKRPSFHFSVYYNYYTGELMTGYNNEIYIPTEEDIRAIDWELI
jgi:hypothetical protein